jgi:hypothetical protein
MGNRFAPWRSWKALLGRPEWDGAERSRAADHLAQIAIEAKVPEAYGACRPRGPNDGSELAEASKAFGEKVWMALEKTWIAREAPKSGASEAPKPAKRL